jgi:hypothetical protein
MNLPDLTLRIKTNNLTEVLVESSFEYTLELVNAKGKIITLSIYDIHLSIHNFDDNLSTHN